MLDAHDGEIGHPPPARLWSNPKVLITPHISGASDDNRRGAIDLCCANLRAYLAGEQLQNVVGARLLTRGAARKRGKVLHRRIDVVRARS